MTAPARSAVMLLAGILLLGGCSNHSGLTEHTPPPDVFDTLSIPVPSGFAIAGGAASTGRSRKPSPRSTPSTSAGRTGLAPVTAQRAGTGPSSRSTTTSVGRTSSPAPRTTPVAAPPSGPRVSVSPATDLRGGQSVQVLVTGFAVGKVVRIRECRSDGGCNILDVRATTDTRGRVSTNVTVSSRVGVFPCGSHGCVISVRRVDDGSGASAPISFA